jgi:DNA-binding NarL/FixJ family response regulator
MAKAVAPKWLSDAARFTQPHVLLLAEGDDLDQLREPLILAGIAFQEFASPQALLETPLAPPDAVLLIHRAGPGGASASLEWYTSLAGDLDDVPAVIVSEELERWEARSALTAGVAGLVRLEQAASVLPACLAAVLAGQVCVPKAHAGQIEPPALSNREKQILGLVVMGESNEQIARALFVAESTVKSHLSSAFSKLGVRSRNDATNIILDPSRGLGLGILALGGERLDEERRDQ